LEPGHPVVVGTTGPGVLSVGGMTWQPGGTYRWRVSSALGANDGITQSKLAGSGTLDLTGLSSASRFTIQLVSLTAANASGAVYDFDNTKSYSWPVATFGSVSGFAADKFTIDTAPFVAFNPLNGGSFAVTQSGGTVSVAFNPVPEPAAGLFV